MPGDSTSTDCVQSRTAIVHPLIKCRVVGSGFTTFKVRLTCRRLPVYSGCFPRLKSLYHRKPAHLKDESGWATIPPER